MKTDPPNDLSQGLHPTALLIDSVDLNFETGVTTVSAMLALRRNLASPAQTLVLDGDELENLSVAVDGQKVPFSVAANTLTIADVPDAFHAVRRFRM
ncbi:MAG: hypothetical protein WBO95_13470 [Candidatus Dechloromonas phosphoritropha]|jgi:aminopeptidase N